MSFSPRQQGKVRPLVTAAWRAICKANNQPVKDPTERDLWYRAELLEAIGKDSTKTAGQTRDFERCMAHFEAIVGDSIYWQMAQFRGDARRILHEIDAICEKHKIDEDYLRRIARVALKFEAPPQLIDLTPDQLLIIVRAARIHARRKSRSASPSESHISHSSHTSHSPSEPEIELSDEDPF